MAISRLVTEPSLSGTENSAVSARDAGPAATTPATAMTIQKTTTVRLWERTQRVREDMEPSLPAGRAAAYRECP